MPYSFIVQFFGFVFFYSFVHGEDIVRTETVNTKSGPVFGVRSENLFKFYDIPYAKPPLGELRFAKTQPVEPWTEPYNATKRRNICLQESDPLTEPFIGFDYTASEDCLTLTITTPSLTTTDKLPVMVFIHGGGLYIGTGNAVVYDGSTIVSKHQVVLVSMNYRLGAFGFLSFGTDSSAPGNVGFYDQLESLKWIHENIGAFGGDNSRITIFGESAGSWSVTFHLLSPLSWPYFNQAILQSGAPFDRDSKPLASVEALAVAKRFATKHGCNKDGATNEQIIKCLRDLDASTLILSLNDYELLVWPARGVVDGEFIPAQPEELLKEGRYKSPCPVMAGYTRDEGSLWVAFLLPGGNTENVYSDEVAPKISASEFAQMFAMATSPWSPVQQEAIRFHYIGQRLDKDSFLETMVKIYGDEYMICPTLKLAIGVSNSEKVFVYQLDYEIKFMFPKWYGASHGSELALVFGLPFVDPQYSELDKNLSSIVMQHWTNFAKTGSPHKNIPAFKNNTNQPHLNQQFIRYAESGEVEIDRGPVFGRCQLWNHHLDALAKVERKTLPKHTTEPNNASCFGFYRNLLAYLILFVILL